MALWHFALILVLAATLLAVHRLYTVISRRTDAETDGTRQRGRQHRPTHLLVVLGSGGHTAEMIAMLERAVSDKDPERRLDWRDYTHRTWIVGEGDALSAKRAKDFEELAINFSTDNDKLDTAAQIAAAAGSSVIVTVPRARRIHQSILTAPASCLRCMIACLIVLVQQANGGKGFPDLILCNGPATATILILTTILLRLFNYKGCEINGKMRTIYVESWARVKKLSLSGKLLLRIVDRFLVQWPQLEESTNGKAEYLGVLV